VVTLLLWQHAAPGPGSARQSQAQVLGAPFPVRFRQTLLCGYLLTRRGHLWGIKPPFQPHIVCGSGYFPTFLHTHLSLSFQRENLTFSQLRPPVIPLR
jgi:hypothetical protein